jgi:photosystem II stability/assembly factor-like uncharacterized protein
MLILTESGVFTLDPTVSDVPALRCSVDGARRVAEGPDIDVVVVDGGDILLLSSDGERRLPSGIAEPVESVLITAGNPVALLLGTEGARLYHFTEADGQAQPVTAFDQLPCRDGWYTPWGGPPAVRSLAATTDGWVYADIHVGSIMRSSDGGETWEPVTPTLNEDVHQVATCPAAPDRVYANTARAVYISEDRGSSWLPRARDLDERYGRAIAVHPSIPDCILATVSDGPHGDDVHGQLYVSHDAGRNWRHLKNGFPASTRLNINTFQVTFSAEGTAWAAVGNSLYRGLDDATRWELFWEAPSEIAALSCCSRATGGVL